MANKFVESLFEETVTTDDKGLSKFDETKLRKTLEKNKMLGSRNKDIFSLEERKFHTCQMYEPCPLCDKCRNKGSHLYNKCGTCQIPVCVHTYNDKAKMIRRDNFEITNQDLKRVLEKYE